ncbi:hypothetical protein E2C01_061272 [Portunus trituberculatus]|uniref:Uncharacterized protein n=1 Tax=Portunus trituberculatus TaxID=210409 RepID=A0A5B7HDY2_PORTR|nr:hypothetical protein [Portunus trituberculatus]
MVFLHEIPGGKGGLLATRAWAARAVVAGGGQWMRRLATMSAPKVRGSGDHQGPDTAFWLSGEAPASQGCAPWSPEAAGKTRWPQQVEFQQRSARGGGQVARRGPALATLLAAP